MLNLYRRHRANCKSTVRRAKCSCPIWVQGVLRGESVRKSLDLTNWEAASRLIRDWEVSGADVVVTVREATKRFISDRQSMKLSDAMMSKYRNVVAELEREFGNSPLRSVTTDGLRRLRESWKLAPITMQKRLEMVRKFFTFCMDSDWIEKNPARGVESPPVKYDPTLPFTDEEMEKILWAAESIREAHPQIPKGTEKKLKALILLMRYSGIRISDAVMFRRDKLKNGKLFLKQEKTKHPVWVPLPKNVISDCGVRRGERVLFLSEYRETQERNNGVAAAAKACVHDGRSCGRPFAPATRHLLRGTLAKRNFARNRFNVVGAYIYQDYAASLRTVGEVAPRRSGNCREIVLDFVGDASDENLQVVFAHAA